MYFIVCAEVTGVIEERKKGEAKENRCGSAGGYVRWVVRVGLIENMTLGQGLGGGEGVSHEDECRGMFLAKGTASNKG